MNTSINFQRNKTLSSNHLNQHQRRSWSVFSKMVSELDALEEEGWWECVVRTRRPEMARTSRSLACEESRKTIVGRVSGAQSDCPRVMAQVHLRAVKMIAASEALPSQEPGNSTTSFDERPKTRARSCWSSEYGFICGMRTRSMSTRQFNLGSWNMYCTLPVQDW